MMKQIGMGVAMILVVNLILILAWGAKEMSAHYQERKYLFEWQLQQQTLVAVSMAVESMIRVIKE